MADFLLEIGCEEIPARMIDAASQELRERVQKLLERERLTAGGEITYFDTPRRLAILASGIPAVQPDITEKLTGPSTNVAYKDGQPTGAAQAFAKKAGVDISQLEKITTAKGEYLAATITKKGRAAAEVLSEFLPKEINSIYWAKNMYWRKPSERFVRPVRWLVALLDGEVVPLEFAGIRAGNTSRGHRIIGQASVEISSARGYSDALKKAHVVKREDRLEQVRKALDAATRAIPGARWREDKALLDTVVNLTEWPSVILGNFESEFLVLPEEVLVTVMRDHQKYFAIEDASGKLLPHFLAVLNTDGDAQGIIRHGHERVLRARFNDARFFWQTDQKYPLRERLQWLKTVTFQKDLGSYHEKTLRLQRLASWLCESLKQGGCEVRAGIVHKALSLAKADLTTELVKEFTELQGIVGGLYASVQELDEGMADANRQAIATAVYDQYKPVSMEDSVPRTVEGAVVAIADKADSIAGMFSLGLQPTGSKDPFALRRQANGIVKTIAEKKLSVNLNQLFADARETYRGSTAEKKFAEKDYTTKIREFYHERLEFFLLRGFRYDIVKAVLAADDADVVDAVTRAQAFTNVRQLPDFEILAGAFKRIKNILRQAKETERIVASTIQPEFFVSDEEKELYSATLSTAQQIKQLRELPKFRSVHPEVRYDPVGQVARYEQALVEISKVRPAVDKFFDKVMVMVDDEKVRANRLALLQTLLKEFSTIADFSEIVTEGSKESPKQ